MSDRKFLAGVTADRTKSGFLLIEVAEGIEVAEPVLLSFPGEHGAGWELVIGKGASVTVVEELTGSIATHRTSVKLGEDAKADIISLQVLDESATCVIEQEAELRSRAVCQWRNVTLGGHEIAQRLISRLVGDNAVSGIDWIFYGKTDERYRLSARNVFLGRDGGGEILMKGVSEHKAQLKAEGMIEIGPQGGGTNTFLTQQVLMLDPTSKIDAIPGLEIHTNDVKASHSATVARLTPEDLFTFASRGIPEHEARRMFVEGFLGDITAKMPAIAAGRCLQLIKSKYQR